MSSICLALPISLNLQQRPDGEISHEKLSLFPGFREGLFLVVPEPEQLGRVIREEGDLGDQHPDWNLVSGSAEIPGSIDSPLGETMMRSRDAFFKKNLEDIPGRRGLQEGKYTFSRTSVKGRFLISRMEHWRGNQTGRGSGFNE